MAALLTDPRFGPNQDKPLVLKHIFIARLWVTSAILIDVFPGADNRNGMAIYKVIQPSPNLAATIVDEAPICWPILTGGQNHKVPGLYGYYAVIGYTYGDANTPLSIPDWRQCALIRVESDGDDAGVGFYDEAGVHEQPYIKDFRIWYQVGHN